MAKKKIVKWRVVIAHLLVQILPERTKRGPKPRRKELEQKLD